MLQKNTAYNRLQKLGGSDFEIADGQPDIRGWDVKDASGEYIGEVDELLFDETSRKVRYIVLDLEGNAFDLEARDVLVPIGMAQLHEHDDEVVLAEITAAQLNNLPAYDHDSLNEEQEHRIRNAFTGDDAVAPMASADQDFYAHEHFNDNELYRNRVTREADTGTPAGTGTGNSETGGMRLRTRTVNDQYAGNKEPGQPGGGSETGNRLDEQPGDADLPRRTS